MGNGKEAINMFHKTIQFKILEDGKILVLCGCIGGWWGGNVGQLYFATLFTKKMAGRIYIH